MSQPINTRLFEIALGLSFGVLLGHFYNMPSLPVNAFYLGMGLVLVISYSITAHHRPQFWWFFRLWFFCLWTVIGGLHYTNQRPTEPFKGDKNNTEETHEHDHLNPRQLHALQVQARLKPWGNTARYQAVYHCPEQNIRYKVALVSNDSLLKSFIDLDQTLWTHTTPKVISKSKNPGGFDPKAYYQSQGIERYIQISSKEIYCWSKHPLSFKARAQKINARLAQLWQKAPISNASRALALAIILGQTEDLTQELKTQFAHAGALHVLALSGMHVAMVVLLLKWLLTPLKSLAYGTKIQAFTLILLLWFYATICGLSPSITRAVCMFSVWQCASLLGRPISGSNSLILSYILLLWAAPYWLFSVGFQLSFVAVMALTFIPSRIESLWRPKNKIYRYLVQLHIVGMAAQIGVGPLSVYYFHQFPLMFWLSNFIILPLMGPVVVLGVVITLSSIMINISPMVFDIWEQLIQFILSSVEWISSDEDLLLDELNLSIHNLCSYYLLALFLWWGGQHPWINKRKIITLYCPLLLSIISTGHIVQRLTAQEQEIQFALLHRYKHTVVIAKTKEGVLGFSNAPEQNSRLMRDYTRHNNQILTRERALSSIMRFDQIPIIVIDSSGLYPQLSGAIVLLTKNANIHLEQLVHELKPRVILADGSNNQNVVQRWRKHAKEINQKFLDTYKFGAIEARESAFKNYL